ncbi:MAG: glycine--tRNA ligase subunit beta [bacterium]|nr:glycine--tRNA ligase subunit beta [bacterium]
MRSKPFLFEIGVEELPASYLAPYAEQLARIFTEECAQARLAVTKMTTAWTPRRLVLYCEKLAERQPVTEDEVKGPPVSIAFHNGIPSRAAEAFAAKVGQTLDQLERRVIAGKEYLVARVMRGGAKALDLLPSLLVRVIRKLRAPKTMRWDDKPTVFARPIRWLVALYGARVVPLDLDGLHAGRLTRGHRFLSPGVISLRKADYDALRDRLYRAHVILEAEEREREIERQLVAHGARPDRIDRTLVRLCANLVEWPSVVRGQFPQEMLELPEVVLVTALKKHQHSFCLYDDTGNLCAGFLAVANNDLRDEELIRSGYERVVVARLADARFFWNEDRAKKLADRVDALKKVVFQEKLGTYYEKSHRVRCLAEYLATLIGRDDLKPVVSRAATLARADLTTAMVFEFPELQGTMGRIYARVVDGEPEEVSAAIEEMYQPRGAEDALPSTVAGAVLSVADKIDTLVGCCAVGLGPTGSADPYALRRQALGLLRIIVAQGWHFSLADLISTALKGYHAPQPDSVAQQVQQLLHGRMETLLRDEGVRYDVINAVIAPGWNDASRVVATARALMKLLPTPEFQRACTVVERCHNITRDAEETPEDVRPELFTHEQENILWTHWHTVHSELQRARAAGDIPAAVALLAGEFHNTLHTFFDQVLVMEEDARLRRNRLALVRAIRTGVCQELADLARIVFEGEENARRK